MSILKILSSSNYISTNKFLAKQLGLYEAVILGELAGQQDYYECNDEVDEEGYFYCTVSKLEDCTTLKEDVQRRVLKHLQSLKIINIKYKGLPRQRFLKINVKNLISYLEDCSKTQCRQNAGTRSGQKQEQGPAKNRINNNINNKNKNINTVVEEENLTTNENNSVEYRELEDLEINELQKLKQVVLENRDTKNITYREIQKQFQLVDKITYDTPMLCNELIKLKLKKKEVLYGVGRDISVDPEVF